MTNITRGMLTGGTLFEELGFYYVGPVDGHDLDTCCRCWKTSATPSTGPDSPACGHREGQGHTRQGAAPGVSRRRQIRSGDLETPKAKSDAPSYTSVFANALIREAEKDQTDHRHHRRHAVGHRSRQVREALPGPHLRCRHRRAACRHLRRRAGGRGLKPFCAIYSTFLQRAYDQVVHDVALQRLPVRFAIDRAGLVGQDGATHAGSYDLAYLACLPNFVIMAASDEAELVHMVATAAALDDRPVAFRYPRGEGVGVDMPEQGVPLEIGKGRIIVEGSKVAILCLGTRLQACLKAAEELRQHGLPTTVADARFAKPLDTGLVRRLAREHEVLITMEDGAIGGFGSLVMQHLAWRGMLDGGS